MPCFGSADSTGVSGAFCGSADSKGLSGEKEKKSRYLDASGIRAELGSAECMKEGRTTLRGERLAGLRAKHETMWRVTGLLSRYST